MGFVESMKTFLSKIHPKILTSKNIICTSLFKGMVLYSKSFYQAWNCWISFKSQAKWVREEGNQREQFISSWERAVKCCHVWAETKLVRLSCQGNVVGEELYCPGKSPKRNVPLKSMLNLLFWVLRLNITKKKQLQLWHFTNKKP